MIFLNPLKHIPNPLENSTKNNKRLAVVQAKFFNKETYTAILLILNDDKNTTQSRWIKIYSSKILFTSFHLNNQTESERRILSSCLFDFNIFEVGEDGNA